MKVTPRYCLSLYLFYLHLQTICFYLQLVYKFQASKVICLHFKIKPINFKQRIQIKEILTYCAYLYFPKM